jgi:hypothetical protein
MIGEMRSFDIQDIARFGLKGVLDEAVISGSRILASLEVAVKIARDTDIAKTPLFHFHRDSNGIPRQLTATYDVISSISPVTSSVFTLAIDKNNEEFQALTMKLFGTPFKAEITEDALEMIKHELEKYQWMVKMNIEATTQPNGSVIKRGYITSFERVYHG